MVNLHLIIFEAWWILNERAFYCFIILFVLEANLDLEKQIIYIHDQQNIFAEGVDIM